MAKDRLNVCKYYTYEGGPCDKRGLSVYHRYECQKCKLYEPRETARGVVEKSKKEKIERAIKKERIEY